MQKILCLVSLLFLIAILLGCEAGSSSNSGANYNLNTNSQNKSSNSMNNSVSMNRNSQAIGYSNRNFETNLLPYSDRPLRFSAGYIEYWNNMKNRSAEEWTKVLNDMREAKMDTIIIKHLAYTARNGTESSFVVPDNAVNPNDLSVTDPTNIILNYADSKDHPMKVYIGLWEDDRFADESLTEDYLTQAAAKDIDLAGRLWKLYGSGHSSFQGWYISHELWNIKADAEKQRVSHNFLKTVTQKLKETKNDIAMSAYFHIEENVNEPEYSSPQEVTDIYRDSIFKDSGINILMLQDSLIVNTWSEDKLPKLKEYFKAYSDACRPNNIKMWALVENFENDKHPAKIERIKKQFRAEKDFSDTFVTFEYYHYMNKTTPDPIPLSPLKERRVLYNDYKRDFVDIEFKP